MKFGVHFQLACSQDQTPAQLYKDAIEQAVYAESLGFESVWPVEQHFNQRVSTLPAPMLFLAAVAAKTTTLKLGTAITILPLHHPVRVAEELSSLDVISNGRVEFGFGRGAMPSHFEGFGASLEESKARMLEALAIIEMLLAEDNCSYSGKHYQIDGLTLSPKPLQSPFPSPRAAANSVETFKLMGKLGYPVFAASHINPFFMLKDLIRSYQEEFQNSGHATCKKSSIDLLCPVFIGEDPKIIESDMRESLSNLRQVALDQIAPSLNDMSIPGLKERIEYLKEMSFEQFNRDMAIFETPQVCNDRIEQLKSDFNIDRLICWFNPGGLVSHEKIMESMAIFAKEVIPNFK